MCNTWTVLGNLLHSLCSLFTDPFVPDVGQASPRALVSRRHISIQGTLRHQAGFATDLNALQAD